jgi:hypothetical protein
MSIATTPGKEFEPFLHAVIEEDPQGPALTMLSALARCDLDPWEQAASLADLAPADAVVQLIALLRALPPGRRPPDALVAARLQALLPRPRPPREAGRSLRMNSACQPARPKLPEPEAGAQVATRSGFSYLLIYLVFVAILIGSEWLNASGEALPPATADQAGAPLTAAPGRAARGVVRPNEAAHDP